MKHLTLYEARHRARLTQDELAVKSGVAQGAISAIESGRTLNPAFDTVRRLEAALGIRPGTLTFGEQDCEVSK